MKPANLIFSILLISAQTFASDHIDGPVTTKHRVADLSDFYVFQSPTQKKNTVIVLNTYPLVASNGHFDSKLFYRIHVRKLNAHTLRTLEGSSNGLTLECSFSTPKDHHSHTPHTANCRTSNGLSVSNQFNQVLGNAIPIKMFHGMRSDPFFFNAEWAKAAIDGKLPPKAKSNTMDMLNILSIVIELDLNSIFPDHSLFAFSAEALTKAAPSTPTQRLDRIGRPEITNVSLFSTNSNRELRDLYNLEDTFELSDKARSIFKERLKKNISHYDSIDKTQNWTQDYLEVFTELLSHDYLIFDNAMPCSKDSFMEIERSHVQNLSHKTCGGRRLESDIMDSLYSIYIGGITNTAISDGIDGPSRTVSKTFPYLAPPDLSVAAKLKAFIGRKALGI